MRKTLKKNIILRKTLEEDTASHAVYPAEQGRRISYLVIRSYLGKREGRTSWMYRFGKRRRSGLKSRWIVQLKNQFAFMIGEISLGLMGWSKS